MKDWVLVVSEDMEARNAALTALRMSGLHVSAAPDASEAYDWLCRHAHTYAVLVLDLDVAVSGMNGWELLRRIRGRFDGPRLAATPRIAVISSSARPETERFLRKLGAEAFLRKPVAAHRLVRTVQLLLRLRAADVAQSLPLAQRRHTADARSAGGRAS